MKTPASTVANSQQICVLLFEHCCRQEVHYLYGPADNELPVCGDVQMITHISVYYPLVVFFAAGSTVCLGGMELVH